MMHWFTENAPPGIQIESEVRYYLGGMMFSLLYSFGFLLRFRLSYKSLFIKVWYKEYIPSDAQLPEFSQLFGYCHYGFLVIAVSMVGVAIIHYAYHFQGSKSVYLMRRLPDRREFHRRCLRLPVLGAAAALAAAALTVIVYFAIYMLVPPDRVLPPDQMEKIWSVLI